MTLRLFTLRAKPLPVDIAQLGTRNPRTQNPSKEPCSKISKPRRNAPTTNPETAKATNARNPTSLQNTKNFVPRSSSPSQGPFLKNTQPEAMPCTLNPARPQKTKKRSDPGPGRPPSQMWGCSARTGFCQIALRPLRVLLFVQGWGGLLEVWGLCGFRILGCWSLGIRLEGPWHRELAFRGLRHQGLLGYWRLLLWALLGLECRC